MTGPVRLVLALPRALSATGRREDVHRLRETLERLGPDVEIVEAASPDACARAARRADALVVDVGPPAVAAPLLDALEPGGPPLIAVVSGDAEEDAVAWFRHGAAECVRLGPEASHTLTQVVLEQVRLWRDRCARSRAERRIAWLEQLNAAIVSEIPAALAVLDAENRVVTVNPTFVRIWGASSEVALGRPLSETLPRSVRESGQLERCVGEARQGLDPTPRLARWEPSGGEPRSFDVRVQRLDAEGRVLLVLTDVTEREALTKRMAGLRRYTENIIQNMNSALLVVDPQGRVTFANRIAEEILGVEAGGLRDRPIWSWFKASHAEGALLVRTLKEGRRYRGAETLLTRADGRVIPIGISCAPLLDAEGASLGAVAIFQDLTEITLLQQQVLQKAKLASIGELAAGIAHEINNPMGFIHANLFQMGEYLGDLREVWKRVEGLREAVRDGDPEAARLAEARLGDQAAEVDVDYVLDDFAKAIRESQEGSERIRHIVRDLRDFSRQDSDERVPADLNQCLDSTANIVWSMMKHSVVLRKEYAELPRIRCHPMQLKQVFMNLLVNAYQAIQERIGEGGDVGEIELRTECRGDSLVVAVSDTGTGIPEGDLERIFDPFFTTKEVGVGTGLGLSTSYSIVRKHGGILRASNRDGPGATFEVVLPLAEGAR